MLNWITDVKVIRAMLQIVRVDFGLRFKELIATVKILVKYGSNNMAAVWESAY